MVMSPVGLISKNYCAGEDQQQFSSQQSVNGDSADILVLKLGCNKRSAYIGRPTPPLEEEAPFRNTNVSRREQKS
jgi:hypothetical protein